MTCPRCSAPAAADALDCPSCGIVFAKWRSRAERPTEPEAPSEQGELAAPAPSPSSEPLVPPPTQTLGITRAGWKASAIGFGMACALTFFPLLSFLLHPLITLVHEIGHTVVFWIFGYNAVPAFDFSQGGGVTMGDVDRSPLIVAGWVVGFSLLAWWQRERKRVLIALAAVAVVYLLVIGSPNERVAIALGGHAGEILFAAVFLYRGLTGWGCKREFERPLYAFLAFMILFSDLRLGTTMLGTSLEKALYIQGKSYADADLVTAGKFLNWKVEAVARGLILTTLLGGLAAFAAASLRHRLGLLSEDEEPTFL